MEEFVNLKISDFKFEFMIRWEERHFGLRLPQA